MSLNNDCAKIQESLSAYIDNEDVDKAFVESHLSTCNHCNDVLQKLNDAKNLLVNLPPSIPQRDFTSDLEKKLGANGGNIIQGRFSKTALAAIFIALTGIIGFYAISNSPQSVVNNTVANVPQNTSKPVQQIEKPEDKIATQPMVKVAKEPMPQKPTSKKEKEISVQIASTQNPKPAPLQTAIQVQTQSEAPVNIALNTGDLASENGLFDDMGFGSDEDGLYAIKL
ncbi:MAG: zf-HC2 domain-containing protein [Candidatus Melainabacteria bacterium]|nr:zf-HC2 domain-containing protein [Candidatus Melainabacteria bacterium]